MRPPRLHSLLLLLLVAGCGHFRPKVAEQYVYVTAKGANLRDRVAAVSNRTGSVANGDKLKVLDHGRHFVKVETPRGEIGWIEEKAVATEDAAAAFEKLRDEHKDDRDVASAVVRDQVYMHLKPGRETERFYLEPEGEKLKLLRRATLAKTVGNSAPLARAQRAIPQAAGSNAALKHGSPAPVELPASTTRASDPAQAAPDAPPAMEDWWLVRDRSGHTGWIFARMLDVDAPDALTRYAEGQRIVGAYLLATVHDEQAPGDLKDIPEYVTVLSPYKAGLPYDFDQVRVFTWSLNHHRYETAYRESHIVGFLPVEITRLRDPGGKGPAATLDLPAFRYHVLPASAGPVVPDPVTGIVTPGRTLVKTFRLEGNTLRRIVDPGVPPEAEARLVEEKKAPGKKGAAAGRR